MIYIVDDMLWVIFLTNPGLTVFTDILAYLQTGILAAFTFFWFQFAEYYIDGFLVKKRVLGVVFALPLAAALLTTLFFCLNRLGVIGNSLFSTTYLYNIDSGVDFFYMVFAFFQALVSMIRAEHDTKRQRCRVILECVLYPAVGAIVSLYIFYVPFIILGILPSIIKILIEMQNANIYTDALTGINNRHRVNEFLERELSHCSERTPMVVYIMDVDRFKGINDRYGHLEGDRALIAVADSLKKIGSDGIVIGRFGGDEFILADARNHNPEEMIRKIRKNLQEAAEEQNFPFSLSISVGYAICTDPSEKINDVQMRADEALYRDKKRKGCGRF